MTQRIPDLIERLDIEPAALERLRLYEGLLHRWSKVKNLVAPGAFRELWVRHILDSAQVQRCLPEAGVWVDLGSGGGFPGIVTAILLAERPGSLVHLIESDNRKCAFLRAVSRETGLRTQVHHGRIEDMAEGIEQAEAVSARALADMETLIAWAEPWLLNGAVGVFLKGKAVASELTALTRDSRFNVETSPSISQSDGVIVKVRAAGV